jgi:hypothetical protein
MQRLQALMPGEVGWLGSRYTLEIQCLRDLPNPIGHLKEGMNAHGQAITNTNTARDRGCA